MLSLRLDGMVIQSQIPTKFTTNQPELNRKSVNIKKEFHMHHALFRQVPCLISKNSFKMLNNFGFFKSICDTLYAICNALTKSVAYFLISVTALRFSTNF